MTRSRPSGTGSASASPPEAEVRAGVRLGIDVGTVRVGVAASDPTGTLASPVDVLRRARDRSDIDALAALAAEREAVEIVVGMPRSLRDRHGPAAAAAHAYAIDVARRVAPIPVRLVDERLSTAQAQRSLHETGHTVRSSRSRIDSAAAVVILQSALDQERATGEPAGDLVEAS
jgi:putative Holliday junction resolvase